VANGTTFSRMGDILPWPSVATLPKVDSECNYIDIFPAVK